MFSLLKHPLHTYKVLSGPSFAIYQIFNIKKSESLTKLSILYFATLIAHKTYGQNVLKWKLPIQ